jgi:serine/threonine protein kinase
MAPTEPSEREADDEKTAHVRSFLIDCLDEPGEGKERLPYLVSLLESEERSIRFTAAMTCCLVAIEADDDEINEYLVRRMSDRLGEEASLELTTALDYLSSLYADQVEQLLEEMDAERRDIPLPKVGNFTREHYYSRDYSREGVGRTQVASTDENDPRQTYADRLEEERDEREHDRERPDETDDGESDAEPEGVGPAWGDEFEDDPEAMLRRTTEVSTIAVRSRFDELYIRGDHRRSRYADTYEALVGGGSEEQAVSLRLLHRPEQTDSVPVFERELESQISEWATLDSHPQVVSVLDWGLEPQPWVVTPFSADSLSNRDPVDIGPGLDIARKLASALAHLHAGDFVHGGIDPGNVVVPGESLDETVTHELMLDNVGLMNVYRHHFPPSQCLDPRFAAPEYYNDQFGRIDHSTDIYQLGAVCYWLFTGRPPHTGDFERVCGAVLESIPPPPSTVADVPEQLDDLVLKAMAKQKLRRYETTEQFQQELTSLAEKHGDT